ncbi:MAG: S9 family peptidase, partial [Bacteroidales bacterium]|nr:S9 family peptidase [Bacteroidales bacterium]
MKKVTLIYCALMCGLFANAATMKINRFKYAGPYQVVAPYMVNRTDVNGKEFDAKNLLLSFISPSALEQAAYISADGIPAAKGQSISILGFSLQNSRYATAQIRVEGVENYEVYMDGKKLSGSRIEAIPGTHTIAIKYLTLTEEKGVPEITVDTEQEGAFALREDGKRDYALTDVLHGKRFQQMQISPNGQWLITGYTTSLENGRSFRTTSVSELATVNVVAKCASRISWMPKSNLYCYTNSDAN